MVTTDEKSEYNHVRLSVESQRYFGNQYGGYGMVYTVLPFGLKASPYIYHTIGIVVTSYPRTLSVVTVQYIDDRLGVSGVKSDADAERDGFKVSYVMLQVLTRLGYSLSQENVHCFLQHVSGFLVS